MMVYIPTYLNLAKNYFTLLNIQSIVMIICPEGAIKTSILRDFSKDGFTLSFSIDSLLDKPEIRTGALLDISCNNSSTILSEISKKKMFNMATEWLIIDEENIFSETIRKSSQVISNNILKDLLILPGSCVTLALVSEYDGKTILYETYRLAMWEPLKFNLLAVISLNDTIEFSNIKRNRNFDEVTLRGAAAVFYPEFFNGWEDPETFKIDTNAKATHAVIDNIATHLNFSYTTRYTGGYGYQNNGTFDGIMGYVQRQEVDMSLIGLMMNEDRMVIADFTGGIIPIRSPMIFRQPALSTVSNIFLMPFQKSVWILSGIVSILFAFVLFLNLFLKLKILRLKETKDTSIAEIFSVVMAYICQQGTGLELKPGAGRILLCILSMFCFFLSVSFSAKIVALLQSSTHTIKSLTDLINAPMSVGMQDEFYNELKFTTSTDEEVKNLYHKKILPGGKKSILSPEKGIQKVKDGLYAFKVETPWAYGSISQIFQEKEKCDLDELHVFILPMMSMALQKKSGYREHFTRSLSRQREVGVMKRVEHHFYPQKPSCNSKGLGFTSVKLADFKPVLEVITFGLILSICLYILEILSQIRFNFEKSSRIVLLTKQNL